MNTDLGRLSYYYTNATSLGCKISELQLIAFTSKPHIIAITETWFTECSSVNISGYNIYRRDRASHAGGVCIYVRNELDSCEVNDDVLTNSAVEQVWCAIRICNEKILLGCIYIPDPYSENLAMFNSLSKVDRLMNKGTYTGLMLTGDFNQSSTSWDNLGFPTTSKKSETRFTDFVRSSNLFQHVDFPIFLLPGCEAKSILDLIFTEKPNRIDYLAAGAPLADLR